MAGDVQVAVRLPTELVELLDAYVTEDRERSRSSVIREALRRILEAPAFTVRGDGVADWTDEFDRAVERVPEPWRGAAVDVRDTMRLAKLACISEFGLPVAQETVVQVTQAMLARAKAESDDV